MKPLLLVAVALLLTTIATAQTDTLRPRLTITQTVYSIVAHYGTALVHTQQVSNIRGAKPRGIELEWASLNADTNTYKTWGFYNRQGLSLSYFNFNTPILGEAYAAAYFIEPIFKLSNNVELRVKGTLGLGYLTHPNPNKADSSATANFNYGSHLNAFLQLGVGVSTHLNQHLSVDVRGTFNHNSNGGFAVPNRGINYPTLSIGFLYYMGSNHLPVMKKKKDKAWRNDRSIKYEAALFASPKDGWEGERYYKKLLVGGMFLASKRMSNINALTLAVEAYHDGGMQTTKQSIGDHTSSFFAGMLIGNELRLSKFVFSQQIGFHLYKNTDYYNNQYLGNINALNTVYQRYGLTYQASKKWKLGFSMLSRKDFADFIDMRMLFRIK